MWRGIRWRWSDLAGWNRCCGCLALQFKCIELLSIFRHNAESGSDHHNLHKHEGPSRRRVGLSLSYSGVIWSPARLSLGVCLRVSDTSLLFVQSATLRFPGKSSTGLKQYHVLVAAGKGFCLRDASPCTVCLVILLEPMLNWQDPYFITMLNVIDLLIWTLFYT